MPRATSEAAKRSARDLNTASAITILGTSGITYWIVGFFGASMWAGMHKLPMHWPGAAGDAIHAPSQRLVTQRVRRPAALPSHRLLPPPSPQVWHH
jgi:hypothetical protein